MIKPVLTAIHLEHMEPDSQHMPPSKTLCDMSDDIGQMSQGPCGYIIY